MIPVVDGPGMTIPIGDVEWRSLVRVRGRVRSERVLPWEGTRTLELVVVDETGGITAVFTGRRSIPDWIWAARSNWSAGQGAGGVTWRSSTRSTRSVLDGDLIQLSLHLVLF